ncbi:MAG: hypothetical protein M3498_08250, partial [Deinococcota bacterium]|nr:hypothetical protein [Deinococcota bacterium]
MSELAEELDEAISKPLRRVVLCTIPLGALAFLLGWIFERPTGQTNPFDQVAYPLLFLSLTVLEVMLLSNKRTLRIVIYLIVAGIGAFFLLKLTYLLYLAPPSVNVQAEMTETFYWTPAIYLLALMFPDFKHGQYTA